MSVRCAQNDENWDATLSHAAQALFAKRFTSFNSHADLFVSCRRYARGAAFATPMPCQLLDHLLEASSPLSSSALDLLTTSSSMCLPCGSDRLSPLCLAVESANATRHGTMWVSLPSAPYADRFTPKADSPLHEHDRLDSVTQAGLTAGMPFPCTSSFSTPTARTAGDGTHRIVRECLTSTCFLNSDVTVSCL